MYVKFSLPDWHDRTSTLSNTISDVSWDNISIQADVNRQILSTEKMCVTVYNETEHENDTILGLGYFPLRPLCNKLENSGKYSLNLQTESVSVGYILLLLQIFAFDLILT